MLRIATRLLSPGGRKGSLSVLFFHRVVAERDPMLPGEPTADEFDRMMGWVQSQFTVLPLGEGVRRLAEGSLPPAAAAITFDDGYRDNLEVAGPILLRRKLPTTLFVATGFIDGGIMFNDIVIESLRRSPLDSLDIPELGLGPLSLGSWGERSAALSAVLPAIKYAPFAQRESLVAGLAERCKVQLPSDLMMTGAQVRRFVDDGFEVGAHTANHPILAVLSDEEARQEIKVGREALEAMVGRPVRLFAYPNGRWGKDFDGRHRDMAQACGFDAAFSTEPGVATVQSDLWNLPRFTPWDRTSLRFRLRMLRNCLGAAA